MRLGTGPFWPLTCQLFQEPFSLPEPSPEVEQGETCSVHSVEFNHPFNHAAAPTAWGLLREGAPGDALPFPPSQPKNISWAAVLLPEEGPGEIDEQLPFTVTGLALCQWVSPPR